MSGVCDPDYLRCLSVSDCVGLISLWRVGQCAARPCRLAGQCWVVFTLLPFCGAGPCVVLSILGCVLVSFRSAFANRWGVEGRASRRWGRKLRRRQGGGERDFTFYSKL